LVITILFFIPLFDQGGTLMRSRITITEMGIVFPDLDVEWNRWWLPDRYAVGFDELRKIQILKDTVTFTLDDEVLTIHRKDVPEFNRFRESLKRAYVTYRGVKGASLSRNIEDELGQHLDLAKRYGLMSGWSLGRLRKEIDALYGEVSQRESVLRFLDQPERSLEDILVTSFTSGFFVLPGFTVEEVVDGANDCLAQHGIEVLPGAECSSYELERRKQLYRSWRIGERYSIGSGFGPGEEYVLGGGMGPDGRLEGETLQLPFPVPERMRSSGDPCAVLRAINDMILDIDLVFLVRGTGEPDPDEPTEFLLVDTRHAHRIIHDGKLEFTRL
jgi:hypothetical protein